MGVAACAVLASVSLVPLSFATASGTLPLKAEIRNQYPPTTCPAAAPQGAACFTRTGTTLLRGLGPVEESYAYFLDEDLLDARRATSAVSPRRRV